MKKMSIMKTGILLIALVGITVLLVPTVRTMLVTYAQSLSKTLQLSSTEKYLVTCAGGTLSINPVNGKEISGRCVESGSTLPTPTPTRVVQPTATATPTPVPGEQPLGKCGESMTDWHPPVVNGCETEHEHGDAPPQWIADAGYKLSFAGPFNTSPAENTIKHTSMKGFLARFGSVDVYTRQHFASNPMERFGTYHSYEYFARDSKGGVSHWQGWVWMGNPTDPRYRITGDDNGVRPIVGSSSGPGCETWYTRGGAQGSWSWDWGWTICSINAAYQRDKEQTAEDAFNRATWKITGGLGLTRRLEASWYRGRGGGGTTLKGKFYTTQFGQIVSGPTDPRCSATTSARDGVTYKNICLEQYIAPTMEEVSFPRNSIQRTFPGQGVKIPN